MWRVSRRSLDSSGAPTAHKPACAISRLRRPAQPALVCSLLWLPFPPTSQHGASIHALTSIHSWPNGIPELCNGRAVPDTPGADSHNSSSRRMASECRYELVRGKRGQHDVNEPKCHEECGRHVLGNGAAAQLGRAAEQRDGDGQKRTNTEDSHLSRTRTRRSRGYQVREMQSFRCAPTLGPSAYREAKISTLDDKRARRAIPFDDMR